MALRIRSDGRILCAALHPAEPGDTYIDDGLHYQLSAVYGVMVTHPMPRHTVTGQWWWAGNAPEGVDRWREERSVCQYNDKTLADIWYLVRNLSRNDIQRVLEALESTDEQMAIRSAIKLDEARHG